MLQPLVEMGNSWTCKNSLHVCARDCHHEGIEGDTRSRICSNSQVILIVVIGDWDRLLYDVNGSCVGQGKG